VITQDTAGKIWMAYREIDAAEKMLTDLAKLRERYPGDKYATRLKDAFGDGRDLQLGIPSGENGHKLIGIAPTLAEAVIRAHIAAKRADLVALSEVARIELGGSAVPVPDGKGEAQGEVDF
jgi:hypothetical protein